MLHASLTVPALTPWLCSCSDGQTRGLYAVTRPLVTVAPSARKRLPRSAPFLRSTIKLPAVREPQDLKSSASLAYCTLSHLRRAGSAVKKIKKLAPQVNELVVADGGHTHDHSRGFRISVGFKSWLYYLPTVTLVMSRSF